MPPDTNAFRLIVASNHGIELYFLVLKIWTLVTRQDEDNEVQRNPATELVSTAVDAFLPLYALIQLDVQCLMAILIVRLVRFAYDVMFGHHWEWDSVTWKITRNRSEKKTLVADFISIVALVLLIYQLM